MAQELKVPFLGEIPMNGCIREYCDRGKIMEMLTEENPSRDALRNVCQNVAMQVFKELIKSPSGPLLEIL